MTVVGAYGSIIRLTFMMSYEGRLKMANVGRKHGASVYALMQKANISLEDFSKAMGYSARDTWNVIEGKVIVPPMEFKKIAEVLGTTKKALLDYTPSETIPELQYMKKIENPENLDLILDLMDEYVECKEVL